MKYGRSAGDSGGGGAYKIFYRPGDVGDNDVNDRRNMTLQVSALVQMPLDRRIRPPIGIGLGVLGCHVHEQFGEFRSLLHLCRNGRDGCGCLVLARIQNTPMLLEKMPSAQGSNGEAKNQPCRPSDLGVLTIVADFDGSRHGAPLSR